MDLKLCYFYSGLRVKVVCIPDVWNQIYTYVLELMKFAWNVSLPHHPAWQFSNNSKFPMVNYIWWNWHRITFHRRSTIIFISLLQSIVKNLVLSTSNIKMKIMCNILVDRPHTSHNIHTKNILHNVLKMTRAQYYQNTYKRDFIS